MVLAAPPNRRPHLLGLCPPSRAPTAVKIDHPFLKQRLSRPSCSPASPVPEPPTAGARGSPPGWCARNYLNTETVRNQHLDVNW